LTNFFHLNLKHEKPIFSSWRSQKLLYFVYDSDKRQRLSSDTSEMVCEQSTNWYSPCYEKGPCTKKKTFFLLLVKLYYKFQDFLLNMESKKSGEFIQYYVKEEFHILHGSIVETIFYGDQRIFYKNEDENNETRDRWFIKRQDTTVSKQQYDRKELMKINNDKGESLDAGDFLEITANNIYKQTQKTMKKKTKKIGIPETKWEKMNKFERFEYTSLLKQNGITHLLVLSPYVFAATDSATRYNRRTRLKETSMGLQKKTEIRRLPLDEQLKQQIPELKLEFPGLLDNEIIKALQNALKFNTIELATANLRANLKAIYKSKNAIYKSKNK
jgi:hypothetical protein